MNGINDIGRYPSIDEWMDEMEAETDDAIAERELVDSMETN
jgi:hypothetical protein